MSGSQKNAICEALARQVATLTAGHGADRMVVARSSFDEFRQIASFPLGMRVTHKPLQSPRVKMRGRHYFGKRTIINARWVKDGLHSLRTPKLAIVLNGEITFQCGDALLHCKPGHIIFIPPDTPHPDGTLNYLEGTAAPQGNCDILFVGIHADGLVVWLSVTRQGNHYGDGTYRTFGKRAELYLDLLWEQISSSNEYAHRNSGALLLLLMTAICHELRDYQPVQMTRNVMDIPMRGSVVRAKEYIHDHLQEKLTINEVARHVYLSRTQFTSQFRRETGKSFHEYLSDCRFEKAKALLSDPLSLPINRICGGLGIKPGMLRELFLQRLQMTPTQYRETQQRNHRAAP